MFKLIVWNCSVYLQVFQFQENSLETPQVVSNSGQVAILVQPGSSAVVLITSVHLIASNANETKSNQNITDAVNYKETLAKCVIYLTRACAEIG